jgi:hypothetical protein
MKLNEEFDFYKKKYAEAPAGELKDHWRDVLIDAYFTKCLDKGMSENVAEQQTFEFEERLIWKEHYHDSIYIYGSTTTFHYFDERGTYGVPNPAFQTVPDLHSPSSFRSHRTPQQPTGLDWSSEYIRGTPDLSPSKVSSHPDGGRDARPPRTFTATEIFQREERRRKARRR